MTNAQRLDEIMDRAGDRTKTVSSDGTAVRIYRDHRSYTLYHIEDAWRSYNPTPIMEAASAEEAARAIGGDSVQVDGVWIKLRSRRPLTEIIGY